MPFLKTAAPLDNNDNDLEDIKLSEPVPEIEELAMETERITLEVPMNISEESPVVEVETVVLDVPVDLGGGVSERVILQRADEGDNIKNNLEKLERAQASGLDGDLLGELEVLEPVAVLPDGVEILEPVSDIENIQEELESEQNFEDEQENSELVQEIESEQENSEFAQEIEDEQESLELVQEIENEQVNSELAQEIENVQENSIQELEPAIDENISEPQNNEKTNNNDTVQEIIETGLATDPEVEIEVIQEIQEQEQEFESVQENENMQEDSELMQENNSVQEISEPAQENENVQEESEPAQENESVKEESESVQENENVQEESEPLQENEDTQENSEHEQENINTQANQDNKTDEGGLVLKYDFTSGERYVDAISTKTQFDKMLDELGLISKDLLSWQVEKFAVQFANKFTNGDEGDTPESAKEKKFGAFLGGFITNAAVILQEHGYINTAIKCLDQALSIVKAQKKLKDELQALKQREEEENYNVDLSDILGLFGDG